MATQIVRIAGTLRAGNSIAHHSSCPAALTNAQISSPIHSSSDDGLLLRFLRFEVFDMMAGFRYDGLWCCRGGWPDSYTALMRVPPGQTSATGPAGPPSRRPHPDRRQGGWPPRGARSPGG